MTLEELKALPKIELHCHLDGSLSREFLESRLGRKVGPTDIIVSYPGQSENEGKPELLHDTQEFCALVFDVVRFLFCFLYN